MNTLGWKYVGPGPAERSEQAIAAAKTEVRDKAEYARLKAKYETGSELASAHTRGEQAGLDRAAHCCEKAVQELTLELATRGGEALATRGGILTAQHLRSAIRAIQPQAPGGEGL